ncbi:TylF/MycF/NovP-related O-methyltransferase [Fuerstiella marisgermanici]|uniref:Mycinamicin III 3''-O-methyltransferase n=1 Tax=Fuerstiella marisgermanici TaxID=1891926 RepID=A0A1P8WEY3_9PLAN|nr:TylF/MycF/NovP-related O-methyltransferase [Fuerstiella marisgermanici]APZ92613.1 Mycinamicin III 3''-O-methyltransferase [Fuerstiella marisgermanici]
MPGQLRTRKTQGPLPQHHRNTLIGGGIIAAVTGLLLFLFVRTGGWQDTWGWSTLATVTAVAAILTIAGWCVLAIVFRRKIPPRDTRMGPTPPYNAEEYAAVGLGPLTDSAEGRDLYIDLMKRAVTNILYEDYPVFFALGTKKWEVAQEFDLAHRVAGNDGPTQAHTMIGTQRLEHIQSCIEQILAENIPGDFAETGSFRGGATIFMRAVLKGHHVTDRKVFVCDAFVPPQPELAPQPLLTLVQAIAAIPGEANRRRIFSMMERMPQKHRAFPLCENPSDDWITFVLWALQHPEVIQCGDTTSLEHVKSRFARYGLLDEQVVFIPGYFAEVLPDAPIGPLSLLRLDGDTFESTHDAIVALYPKLSPGGFCIIDDYNTFDDCKRAITEYREQNHIDEEIHAVGKHAAFWRKKI